MLTSYLTTHPFIMACRLSDSLVSSNGIISAKLAGKLRFLDST